MQFSHALVLAFIASAAAQTTGTIAGDVAALPACAKTCLDKATLAAGCSSVTGSSLRPRIPTPIALPPLTPILQSQLAHPILQHAS